MNLNQLYYLQAIAQARGLTRAADALYVTQSNLSHSMAALEEELGIPLSELDYHQTGMIGESYTGITTTLASFPLISNAIASASSGVDAGIMLARRTTSGSRYVVTRITGCACRILA